MELNLQFFGGRGAEYSDPSASSGSGGQWSKGIGTRVADELKEALGKKGAPIKMTEAYEDANPNHDKTYTFKEYTENCQRCAIAYELRRRGYDVTAQPTYEGDRKGSMGHLDVDRKNGNVTKWGRYLGAFKGARPVSVAGKSPNEVVDNIEKQMASWGNGSRALISVNWSGGGGHVFNIERSGNTTYYVDAQTGERYRSRQIMSWVNPKTTTLIRTDNLRISDRAKEFVTSEDMYKRRKKRG